MLCNDPIEVDVHCLKQVNSMIHNNYKISLLYETGQVKVCKVEGVASGEKNESVCVGERGKE